MKCPQLMAASLRNDFMPFESCTFEPWRGNRFDEGWRGKRVLLLGESHYAGGGIKADTGPQPSSKSFTSEVIRKWALGETRAKYFTYIAELLGADLGRKEEFWNCIAFYNYVQSIVGNAARIRPTKEMWSAGYQPFCDVLDELRPQAMVVLGQALWNRLPGKEKQAGGPTTEQTVLTTPKGHRTMLGMTRHPSSFGFSPKKWKTHVDSLFADAESA
jgi:hypothetical protein